MPRFLTGDELGCIKSIHCEKDSQVSSGWSFAEKILFTPSTLTKINSGELTAEKARESAIQRLSIVNESGNQMLAAARSNGTLSTLSLSTVDDELKLLHEWKDPRFKSAHTFVGLELSPKGLFWCSSNGALGLATRNSDEGSVNFASSFQKASLPMRLCAWSLSPDASTFAYGGNEVDLSVWDAERTFQNNVDAPSKPQSTDTASASKKRKRGNDLFPAEIWRAKSLPNDALNLRQPIHITALTYLLSNTSVGTGVHLVTGTESGDVRRYDTRAARRPVANWTNIGKVGGVGIVQAGLSEHELFVADNGTNLLALDLRNGRTIYSYKKIQGAITSLAPTSGGFLASTSRDRFFRLHTTFPPPTVAGTQQDDRGEVVETLYTKSISTAVVPYEATERSQDTQQKEGVDAEDDVWASMKDVDDSGEENEELSGAKRRS